MTKTPTAEQSSNKTINDNCRKIRKSATAVNELIHTTALLVLAHFNEYGDCTGAARLGESMPKSFRRGLLAKWFGQAGPIILEPKNGTLHAHKAKEGSKGDKKVNMDWARANPWYGLANDTAEPDFFQVDDVQEALNRLIKRINKKIDDGEVDTTQIAQLRAYESAIKLLAKSVPNVANDTASVVETPVEEPAARAVAAA